MVPVLPMGLIKMPQRQSVSNEFQTSLLTTDDLFSYISYWFFFNVLYFSFIDTEIYSPLELGACFSNKLWPMFLSTFKNSNMAALLWFRMPLNCKVAQHTFLSFCHKYWWLFSFFLPDEFVLKNLMKNIWAKPRFPAIMALLCL